MTIIKLISGLISIDHLIVYAGHTKKVHRVMNEWKNKQATVLLANQKARKRY